MLKLKIKINSEQSDLPHFDVGNLAKGRSAVVAVSAATVPLSDKHSVLDEIVEIVRWRLLQLVAVRRGVAVRAAASAVAGAALSVRGGGGRLLLRHVGAALQKARLECEWLLDGVVEAHLAVAVEQRRVFAGQSHLQVNH